MKRKFDYIDVPVYHENTQKAKSETDRRTLLNGSTWLIWLKENEFPFAKSYNWIAKKLGYKRER